MDKKNQWFDFLAGIAFLATVLMLIEMCGKHPLSWVKESSSVAGVVLATVMILSLHRILRILWGPGIDEIEEKERRARSTRS